MASDTFSLSDLQVPGLQLEDTSGEQKKKEEKPLVNLLLEQTPKPDRPKNKRGELPKDENIKAALVAAAEKWGVPQEYAFALAQQESGYNPNAHNSEYGASGIFQFIPATAKAHGIDPLNVEQAADAAMRDFAAQSKEKGVTWAIKHHFAGPDERYHGPKTAQYLADVEGRAEDIRGLLGGGQQATGAVTQEPTKQTVKGTQKVEKDTFSLADLAVPTDVQNSDTSDESDFSSAGPFLGKPGETFGAPLARAITSGFEAFEDRVRQTFDMEREGFDKVPLSDEDKERQAKLRTDFNANPFGALAQMRSFKYTPDPDEEIKWRNRIAQNPAAAAELPKYLAHLKPVADTQGFIATLENPLKLMLEDSLPANFLSYYANLPKIEQRKFDAARKVMMQQRIAQDNGSNFPQVSIDAARAEIKKRAEKQDPTVREAWHQLREAATADPAKFAAQFVNALVADPEMIAIPMTLGGKTFQATGSAVSRTMRVAEAIVNKADAATVGAGINVGAAVADAAARGQEQDYATLVQAGQLGAAGGVLFSWLGKGRPKLPTTASNKMDDAATRILIEEQAAYDLAFEDVARRAPAFAAMDVQTQAQLNDLLGINQHTNIEEMLRSRREQLKDEYPDRVGYEMYEKALAAKRAERAGALAGRSAEEADAAQREAAKRSEQAERAEPVFTSETGAEVPTAKVVDALRERPVSRTPEAVEAIAAMKKEVEAARVEPAPLTAEQLQAVIDDPATGPVHKRAAKLHLASLKEKGNIDPELAVRMGLTAGAATVGAMFAEEDKRLATSIVAGLTAFMLPGGGRVVSKMRQAGAISDEGFPLSIAADAARMVREGNLKPALDTQERIKARDFDLVQKAAAGDQQAMRTLYDENAPKLANGIKGHLREAGPKLAIDANDVVQEAFINMLPHLKDFRGDASFYTWAYRVVENEAKEAIRKAKRRPEQESYDRPNRGGDDTNEIVGDVSFKDKDAGSTEVTTVDDLIADLETPEANAMRQDVEKIILSTLGRMSPKMKDAFIKTQIELMSDAEAAVAMGIDREAAKKLVQRSKALVADALERGFAARGARSAQEAQLVRLPRGQRGSIDDRLLKGGALAALGGSAAAYFAEENKLAAAGLGAFTLPAFFMMKGTKGNTAAQTIVRNMDQLAGAVSTRIMNKSPKLWMKSLNHVRTVLKDTHKYLTKVDPFLKKLNKLPEGTRNVLKRSILNGDHIVTRRVLEEVIQDPELIQGWKDVRSVLDELGDKLVHLRRFRNKELDYFPRIVKDVDGLLAALGKERGGVISEALRRANVESVGARGTELTQLEQSLLINRILTSEPKGSQPGFAKNRSVDVITPELMKYYADPIESLHSYIKSAVEDIERARFFGKDLKVVKTAEGKEYTNVDQSVGALIGDLIKKGELESKDQAEMIDILKSVFINGEKQSNELIQMARNISTAGILGNPLSATVQLGDIALQMFTQDISSTLEALVRQATGRKHVDMRDFGLEDYFAEEFVSKSRSTKLVEKAFKFGLFKFIDQLGKNTALNAAVIRAGKLAKTPKGQAELYARYGKALGDETFKEWIKDLAKGERSDLVNQMAFAELSRSQPISRLEMPQSYLDHPNGRVLYQFKSFMLKQIDLARREGWNEIKQGNVVKGVRNLAALGLTLGVAGMTTSAIKDFLRGRPVDLKASGIIENALKTFGITQYYIDHAFGVSKEEARERRAEGDKMARPTKAQPFKATSEIITPPAFKMFDDIYRRDPKAVRYIPVVGPLLYDHYISEQKK